MPNITILDKSAPAPAPFLPGTKVQYAWDSTSLGLLKTCPRLYQYVMIDGWAAHDESIHLRFGAEYHSALEDFDHRVAEGHDFASAMREAVRSLLIRTHGWEVDESDRPGKLKNRRSLLRSVINYLDHFRMEPAETYILSNGKPAVELSFRFELDFGPADGQPYLVCGHLDRVVTFSDALFVMDRKTSTYTLGQYWFKQFDVNNQMTLYSLAAKVILEAPIKGVIIDAVQILAESNAFQRGITYRTEDQLEEWTDDLGVWLRAAEGFAEADYWPMNDTSCDKYGGCQFRDICSKSPQVRERFLRTKFVQRPEAERWNPLRPR